MTLEEARINALTAKKAAELAAKQTGYTGLNIQEVILHNAYDLNEIAQLAYYADEYGVPQALAQSLDDLSVAMARYQDKLEDMDAVPLAQ